MNKIPFSQVKQLVLQHELEAFDHFIEMNRLQADELEDDKQSFIQEMENAKHMSDIVNILEDMGHDAFDYIFEAVFDPEK